jgi:hypothetical protein
MPLLYIASSGLRLNAQERGVLLSYMTVVIERLSKSRYCRTV